MKLDQFLAGLLGGNFTLVDRFLDLPDIFVDPALSLAQFMTWFSLIAATILLWFIPPELALDLA